MFSSPLREIGQYLKADITNSISYSQELFNHTILSIKLSKRKKRGKKEKKYTLPVTVLAL